MRGDVTVPSVCCKAASWAFPYPVFGRFAYSLSALCGHCFLVIMLIGFGQCPPISDSLCANSRTLDIGKAQEAALQQTEGTVGCGGERCLGLFWEWVAWYDGGNEKRRAAYVSGSGEAGVV